MSSTTFDQIDALGTLQGGFKVRKIRNARQINLSKLSHRPHFLSNFRQKTSFSFNLFISYMDM